MTYPVYRLFMSARLRRWSRSALYCVIARTRLGMMIRAGASNREMVQSLGVDIVCSTGSCSRPASRSPCSPA